MASTSSSPPPKPKPEPTPLPIQPPVVPTTTTTTTKSNNNRRLPPPCWTPEETSALIDAYRDKWYALHRGNLRAAHWEEVSRDLHSRVPHVPLPKTPLQCRHKMEKLRKRYRSELSRATSIPHPRFSSSWVYFHKMDSMEKGPNPSPSSMPGAIRVVGVSEEEDGGGFNRNPNWNFGVESRFASVNSLNYGSSSEFGGNGSNVGGGMGRKREKKGRGDVGREMVGAIRMMGEGFIRMEEMKIEMMRETERMRMEMEMKRMETILESQHRFFEAFAKTLNDTMNNK